VLFDASSKVYTQPTSFRVGNSNYTNCLFNNTVSYISFSAASTWLITAHDKQCQLLKCL